MDLRNAKRQHQNAASKLKEMEKVRGDHDKFVNLTTEFLERAQSGFESVEDDWGGHDGSKPDDRLLQWLFEIVNDDRHGSQPRLSHADTAVPRSPREFPEDVSVIMESREGDHAYFFPQEEEQEPIPTNFKKTRVTEICQYILSELRRQIQEKAEGAEVRPNDPLANHDQRDDHLL